MELDIINKKKEVVGKALVSEEDFERCLLYTWHLDNDGYPENNKMVKLHNFIKGNPPTGYIWDHVDNIKTDNRRNMLRPLTFAQNSQNRQKRENTSSKYIGVSWQKTKKKWKAVCHQKHLCEVDDEIEAGKAYDRAAFFTYGSTAKTNDLLTMIEIEEVLKSTELDILRSHASVLGKGVYTSFDKFRVQITQNEKSTYIGRYDTLQEAQKVAKKCIEAEERRKLQAILDLSIQRNSQNQAVIPIRNRKGIIAHAIVDDETWHDLMKYSFVFNKKGYPTSQIDGKTIQMHLYLFRKYKGEIPEGYIVDHWGKNETDSLTKKLDNRLENLRAFTYSENSQNKTVPKNASSQYLGVYKKDKKWGAQITFSGTLYYLGTFETEIEAANTYNKKALELYDDTAKLNDVEDSPLTPQIKPIKYIGVWKNNGKWSARLTFEKKVYNIGTFSTEIEAAKAYNQKALVLRGTTTKLNVIQQ